VRHDGPVTREILLSFWKLHILHHADEGPVYGQGILDELRRHGYSLSPGTLYPLLARMVERGWLRPASSPPRATARREYTLTPRGRALLKRLRVYVAELHREIVEESHHES
jgi:DNA-binding PadR family transcriptional regulator